MFMRIVISYFFDAAYIPVGFSLADGFRALGHEVAHFDSTIEHGIWRYALKPMRSIKRRLELNAQFEADCRFGIHGYKRDIFFNLLRSFRPDMILVLKAHEFLRQEDIVRAKEEFGVNYAVGWSVDGPNVSFDLDREARLYDLYYSIHKHGSQQSNVKRLSLCAVDRKRYVRTEANFFHRELFATLVSGWNPRRQAWVSALQGAKVDVYGDWRKANRDNPVFLERVHPQGAWGPALTKLYNRTKIGLNILGWEARLDPCCNLRTMDIPAHGSLLLSEYCEELASYYHLGKEADSFESQEELLDKLDYYYRHPEVAAALALRGYRRSLALPDYSDKAAEILCDLQSSGQGINSFSGSQ